VAVGRAISSEDERGRENLPVRCVCDKSFAMNGTVDVKCSIKFDT